MPPDHLWLVAVGAGATIVSAMLAGLKIERWAAHYLPWLPRGIGPACGLAAGIYAVLTWVSF